MVSCRKRVDVSNKPLLLLVYVETRYSLCLILQIFSMLWMLGHASLLVVLHGYPRAQCDVPATAQLETINLPYLHAEPSLIHAITNFTSVWSREQMKSHIFFTILILYFSIVIKQKRVIFECAMFPRSVKHFL